MQTRTKRQHDVLEYITEFISERGYEPSYQQIARAIGVSSKGAIAKHIVALENQGLIERKRENGSFRIKLRAQNSIVDSVYQMDWLELPGNVESKEELREPEFVPRSILGAKPPKNLRAFRVPNDAMLDEHICAGDIAIVEEQAFARDRDIVVALIDNQRPVIKKFYRRGADIELRPANDQFQTIRLSADRILILGVFSGLIRPLV